MSDYRAKSNKGVPLVERFWEKVDLHLDDRCWEWLGAKNPSGHGRIVIGNRKQAPAHRVAYEFCVGPIPEGAHLDHLCGNPSCVNPKHLEPVSLWENLRRAPNTPAVINAAKTHCPQGHPYDEANTCHSNGRRSCRACARQAQRDRYARDPEAARAASRRWREKQRG